jgi:phage terminase small subunit
MTEKQKIFCDEYLKDLNATRAYKIAYSKTKNDDVARANSSRLLTNANIKKYIDRQLEILHNERTADVQEVMEYLTSVLRGESVGEEIVTEFIGDGVSEAKKINKHPSEKDKLKAAELLGKRFGMFKEKIEVNGSLETEKSKLDSLIEQMSGNE